jgi:peptidoglycan/LPS O-acetylase OafA/YrhL
MNIDSPPDELIRPFMPELDTLRGIAVLGVVLLHGFYSAYSGMPWGLSARRFIGLTRPGWVGVNLFFVLSGFLITGILLDSRRRPYFYRRFYTRRALRILPAYYALLILLLLLRTSSPAFVGLSFIYLANVTGIFGVACDYGPLWSLAVEEHFYILWPMLVHKTTLRRLTFVSMTIVVLVPIFRVVGLELYHVADWYTWFVVDGLATGSLLAIYLRSGATRKQVRRLCWTLLSFAVLAGIVGSPFVSPHEILLLAQACSTRSSTFSLRASYCFSC